MWCHDHLGLVVLQVVPLTPTNPMLLTREAWIMRRWRMEHKYMTVEVYMDMMQMTATERTWFLLQI
jgi:hypothetical protein